MKNDRQGYREERRTGRKPNPLSHWGVKTMWTALFWAAQLLHPGKEKQFFFFVTRFVYFFTIMKKKI